MVIELYPDDFVSGGNVAIPRSMECDENAVLIFGGKFRALIKRESQRSRMRLHLDLGTDHALAAIVASLRKACIWNMIAIAIRPAKIAAILAQINDYFRRQIVTQHIAAIHS